MPDDLPVRDVHAIFAAAETSGKVGTARKGKPIDARPARLGEIVVTRITGEGVETRSKPATAGDWVVRNRSPETGNEEYLVKTSTFAERYEGPLSAADAHGWLAFRPRGPEMRFFILSEAEGAFQFKAPWGEPMLARPGDAIVRNPANSDDTYRVAANAFTCTYEIIAGPPKPAAP